MTRTASFSTYGKPAYTLEPGDVYLWGEMGGHKATREVLGILALGPMGSAHVEVRKADGDVVRSTINGYVQIVPREEYDVSGDYAAGRKFARTWMSTLEAPGNTREGYAALTRAGISDSPSRRIRSFKLGLVRALREE